MIEVEIRSKVEDVNEIKKRLGEIGAQFKGSKRQIDRIFGNKKFLDENTMIIEGGISARIRTVDDSHKLEFKEISRIGGGFEVVSQLSNPEIGIELLEKLDFTEAFTIAKQRETYSYEDFEVAVDNVEKLGCFIEIEKMIDYEADKEKAKVQCEELLHKLDENLAIEKRKYGDLMQELINNSK